MDDMDDVRAVLMQKEAKLREQADKIREMLVNLGEGMPAIAATKATAKSGKSQRSPAARKKASQRMKAYWAAKRAAASK